MEPRYWRVMRGTVRLVFVEGQSVRLCVGDYFSVESSSEGSPYVLFWPCTEVWPCGQKVVDDIENVDVLVTSGVVTEVPKNCHRQEQVWRGQLREIKKSLFVCENRILQLEQRVEKAKQKAKKG